LAIGLFGVLVPTVYADIDNPADARSTFQNFQPFMDRVSEILANTLVSPIGEFAETLFLFFTAALIIGRLSRYIWQGITIAEIGETIALIIVVRVMMVMYGPVTTYMWQWANAFGGGIQQVAVGSDDIFFVGVFIKNIVDRIALADVSIWEGIMASIAIAVLSVILFALTLLAFIASAWPIWGYAVAKLIGWMFIPTILFKRLSFLFDGWLRFFFGFLMYAVCIRVNLSLVAIALGLFFNLPVGDSPSAPYIFPVQNFMDFFGLAAICLISLAGLWSTGKFSAVIAGGVGGVSDGIRRATMAAGRLTQ